MTTYDLSIHHNPDARAWAKFYVETREKHDETKIDQFDDEENMVGWFANAMMAMHDFERSKRNRLIREMSFFQRLAYCWSIMKGNPNG